MVQIVRASDTKRAAFMRGFWKGMAAPLMLYSTFHLPDDVRVEYQALPKREPTPRTDWERVGDSLRSAAQKVRAESA